MHVENVGNGTGLELWTFSMVWSPYSKKRLVGWFVRPFIRPIFYIVRITHGLSVRRARRTKSVPRRAPRLLVFNISMLQVVAGPAVTDDAEEDEESMDWWTKYFASIDTMIEVGLMEILFRKVPVSKVFKSILPRYCRHD